MAWAGRGKVPLSGRLCSLATDDDLEPQDLVREMQRSLELGDDARVRRELGDHVVALVLTIDLERESSDELEDAREVIQWYQYQIAVKTMRALSGRKEEIEDPEIADFPKDSDGSAKVALIGIDRSIAAWRMMQLSLPDRVESIVPLILQLERLQQRLENSFPQARDFVRPGFDEN